MQNYIFYCGKDMVRQKNAICDTLKGDNLNEFIPHGEAYAPTVRDDKMVLLLNAVIT